MERPDLYRHPNAVTVITCTKRAYCMDNLFQNFLRQSYRHKELIVILNQKDLKASEYRKAAQPYTNIRVYSLPEQVPLGNCLNYGVNQAKYNYIAKFDDDDYYAPGYLTDAMRTLARTNADIVGKRAHFMYLQGKKLLLFRYPHMAERYSPMVQGATLLVKKSVFRQVRFRNINRGESVMFCTDSRAKGFSIYSGSPYHFAAFRRKNSKDHTWIVSDNSLVAHGKVLKVGDVRKFVDRKIEGSQENRREPFEDSF